MDLVVALWLLLGITATCGYDHHELTLRETKSYSPVELNCPLGCAEDGDQLSYFRVDPNEVQPTMLTTVKLEDRSWFSASQLLVLNWTKESRYYCEIRRPSGTSSVLVSRTDFSLTDSSTGDHQFIYQPNQTVRLQVYLGKPAEIVCPVQNHIAPDSRIAWYKHPGYQLLNTSRSSMSLGPLKLCDLGIYFCAVQTETTDDKWNIPVQAVEVFTVNHTILKRPANRITNSRNQMLYECPGVMTSPYKPVIWEFPRGTIQVGQSHSLWIPSESLTNSLTNSSQVWCLYDELVSAEGPHGIQSRPFKRTRREISIKPVIKLQPRLLPSDRQITFSCHWIGPVAEGSTVIYRWIRSWNVESELAQQISATMLDPNDNGADSSKQMSITCQAEIAETGEILGTTKISLSPTPIRITGIIDMKSAEQRLFSFERDDPLQIICDVDRNYVQTASEIVWKFNGGPIRETTRRLDRLYASIIYVHRLDSQDEGIYSCEQGEKVMQAHLLEKSVELELELSPESDIRWADSGEDSEFHCRLTGQRDGSRYVDWSFIPEGSSQETQLHPTVVVDRPIATPSTSFITFKNVQKYHEGIYVCRAFDIKRKAKLIVRVHNLSVTPESVEGRPGTTVRFLCELSEVPGIHSGKVYWMRTDRQDLKPGKEEVVGSTSGRALLIVKSLDWTDNNTTYICTDGVNTAKTQVFVRDACAPGFRSCNSRECVESSKFCDGQVDCLDGSDELPSKCRECAPNEYSCETWNGQKPLRNCYLQYWRCDGEDDCGNNYDEVNCPPPTEKELCNGTQYRCPSSGKPIARAFMCDGVADCEPNGEDEMDCSLPSIIVPSRETQLFGLQNGNLTLTCVVYGRPPPTINWRFNWGLIRGGVEHVINNSVVDCNKVISHLILTNLEPQASGLYSCEAVNKGRTLAPDISVTVAKGGLCRSPKFNDAAWFEDMCLRCYCSGVSDRCRSAQGYAKAGVDKWWNPNHSPLVIRQYSSDGSVKEIDGVESTEDLVRFTGEADHEAYVEGTFGLNGSWLSSYGHDLKLKLTQFGPPMYYLPGALISIHGLNQTIYWCPPLDRTVLYALPSGYTNEVSVRITERDRWYRDSSCFKKPDSLVTREKFMDILSQVDRIGVRVRNYRTQENMELRDMALEHTVKSDLLGTWAAEVEQCECPSGYEGLSCERCAPGYERDLKSSRRCKLKCACAECDDAGNCLDCSGNRSGPRCQHCKPGYYRAQNSVLSEDCIPCNKCAKSPSHLVKECITGTTDLVDYLCKCQSREENRLLDPKCDRCYLAELQGLTPPADANCDEKPELSKCNFKGTMTISESGECVCESGYEGPDCDQCSTGYFKHVNQCLECYCAGQTTYCQLSDDYRFWNITMDDNEDYTFDVWLARRTILGGLERMDDTFVGQSRIEQKSNAFIVRYPLVQRGLLQLGIQLRSAEPDENNAIGLPIYRGLYGGQMSFRLDAFDLDPNKVTQGEAGVIVELESSRYGRTWTQAVYNVITGRYEVQFDESWWPGGWKLGTPEAMGDLGPMQGLSRGQLLRVLSTTSALAILTSSGDSDGLRGLKLSGLSVQIARSTKQGVQSDAPVAPVEKCDCPQAEGSDKLGISLSCEGCRNPKQKSVTRLEPLGEDLECGDCFGPACDECSQGQFRYDLYTGERYDHCQTGLTIDTNQRQIVVDEGDPITLACRATSYRGGMVLHEWVVPQDDQDRSVGITERRTLSTAGVLYKPRSFNQSIHRSEALLRFDSIKKADSGLYICRVSALGSIIEQPSYLIVRDKGPILPPSIPEDDQLNRKYFISIPRNRPMPSMTTYRLERDPQNDSSTLISGVVSNPSDIDDHQIVWFSSNGAIIPTEILRLDSNTAEVRVRLGVPFDGLQSGNESVSGFFVGKNPISDPYWTIMKNPEIVQPEAEPPTSLDIITPPSEISIPFMQPHMIRVHVKPRKSKFRVNWTRVGNLPEQIPPTDLTTSELPEGLSQRDKDLMIWAAAEQHEGVYQGVVYRDSDGEELKRFNVTVRVEPLSPGESTHLKPGEAVDLPEEFHEEPATPQPTAWDFLVQGFTPEAEYCDHPTWALIDYHQNTVFDITDKVHRVSPANFRVDYPLTSGIFLRFQCQPVPQSNLTGQIQFNITSDDPRIIFKGIYDNPNSTFPTRLICLDLNPGHESNVNIKSDIMEADRLNSALVAVPVGNKTDRYGIPPRRLELDWRHIGEFDPFSDSGRFTCLVNNKLISGTKTITVPTDKGPSTVPEELFKRVYIYSPDAYVSPEVDGKVAVEVEEDKRLGIYCQFDSRPASNFMGWSSESDQVNARMRIDNRPYSSLIETETTTLELDGQVIDCRFADGQKSVEIKVIPKGKPGLVAQVHHEDIVAGRLIGTTGDHLKLRCDVKQTGSKPVGIERIDWFIQYSNGIRRSLFKSRLAQQIDILNNGETVELIELSRSPTGAKIFCVARPVDTLTATQAYYPSTPIDFWIRSPKLAAHLEPLTRPGLIVATEADTVRVRCVATDLWHNRTQSSVIVTWQTRVTHTDPNKIMVQPNLQDIPWLITKELDNTLLIGDVRQRTDWKGEVRCRVEDPVSRVFAHSDWARIDVKPDDKATSIPKLRIVPRVNPEFPFYPSQVECVDDNRNHASEVTWVRQGEVIPQMDVEMKPNSATLKWKVDSVDRFEPNLHEGIYTCRASNPYASTFHRYYFPLEMMPKDPIPLSDHQVRITSTRNDIQVESGQPYTRVVQGQELEIWCTYYGHPPPVGGLRWTLEPYDGPDWSIGHQQMANRGLRIKSGRRYWTQVTVLTFGANGEQAGQYKCAALDQDGNSYQQAQLRVELYKVNVKIAGLTEQGLLERTEGDNGSLTCNAYDGYSNSALADVTYLWIFEKLNGDRIHPNLLATTVDVTDNRLDYTSLSAAANNFRARCVAVNNTARYISPDFGFHVRRKPGLPVKRPDLERGGTRWLRGDGTEGVLLMISGLNNDTHQASFTEGDKVNLTCTAVDAVTRKPFDGNQFQFGWLLTGPRGEPMSSDQLTTGSTQSVASSDGKSGYYIIDSARASPLSPNPTAKIMCLATRTAESVTYHSQAVDYVVYRKDVAPDYPKEQAHRDIRESIVVTVTSLDSRGMLFASEGSVKTVKCEATDKDQRPITEKNATYSWEFSQLDGMPVDTSVLIQPKVGTVHFAGNEATFSGVRRTSAVRGRCIVRLPDTADTKDFPNTFYSSYFRFDVVDDTGLGNRDFGSPTPAALQSETPGVILKITGLDDNGYLTSSPGQNVTLTCQAINASTSEIYEDDLFDVHYGWEFRQLNGLPAGITDLANRVHTESTSGQIHFDRLKSQPESKPTKARCVVELIRKSVVLPSDDVHVKGNRIAGPYFLFNVPPREDLVPDYVDVTQEKYELTVNGLNEYGVLVLKQNERTALRCIVRDNETDTLMDSLTDSQVIGWQLPVYPSGWIGNPGDVASKVTQEQGNLYLDNARQDITDGLRGRCWFFDGVAYYYSRYFPLVLPTSTSDGRIRVEVQEIGTDDDRRFICAAYNAETGARLLDVSYDWSFKTRNWEEVAPNYYFDSFESRGNEISLRPKRVGQQLPENLRESGPVEGRCLVLYQPFSGNLTKPHRINVYSSNPFILINPKAEDPTKTLIRPDPISKEKSIVVTVDGVDRDLVIIPEGGTVTLTCHAADFRTMEPLTGLTYNWEIQQRDGSPVSTSSLVQKAVLVEGEGGNRVTFVGVRLKASGLRGRCVVSNTTEAEADVQSLLEQNHRVSSTFFDFYVNRTDSELPGSDRREYEGYRDFIIDGDPRQYKVLINGLDKFGRLRVKQGDDATLTVKLQDMISGELHSVQPGPSNIHIGLEVTYTNGQPAPFSALTDAVKIHGQDGVIEFKKFLEPSQPPIQIRVTVERDEVVSRPDGRGGMIVERKRVRYASPFSDVVVLKVDEEEPPEPMEPEAAIFPVVDGLNRCGNLPVLVGSNATLICRPNDTDIPTEGLIYGWELRHSLGQTIPPVGLLAKTIKQQSNRLQLLGLLDLEVSLIGRCFILQTGGRFTRFTSSYFAIGPHGLGCEPGDPTILPDGSGKPHVPGAAYRVRIRIEGLDEDGRVAKQPGSNVTLKCTALNVTTSEPIPNTAIGWDFVSDSGETIHAGQLASRYELTDQNELQLTHLHSNPTARGRCVVTLEQRITLSSPYFLFDIKDESTKSSESVNPSYSDKRVRVEISGLNERRQISVHRVGDDSSLRCQAVSVATGALLHPIQGIVYGWEWRYIDEDPVSTANVAVSLEAHGERLGLRGIQATPGSGGRNVKGRCVVHVPPSLVGESKPATELLVYGSEYFTIDVLKRPMTSESEVIPLPGKAEDNIEVKVFGLDEKGNLVVNEKDSVAVTCEVWNATTRHRLATEGMKATYNVFYGWEFTDVTGRSIDSSLFADSVATDASGHLRLRGLAGPKRGELPFKIRCIATLSKRPATPDGPTGPAKSYTSDFFAISVKRLDGSSTMDVGIGETPPDISGKLINVDVRGLQPDGSLTALPGEDVELKCIGIDILTGEVAQGVIFGWELRRGTGGLLNMGLLANEVIQDGERLQLVRLKQLTWLEDRALGRCIVHRGRQIYRSEYFRINIMAIPKGVEIEGDGRIVVSIEEANSTSRVIGAKPESKVNLTCIARDAKTGEQIPDLNFGWEMQFSPENSEVEVKNNLGPFVQRVAEHPDGRLLINTTKLWATSNDSKIKCRTVNDSTVYTSPFYTFVAVVPDKIAHVPEKPVYPKYRVLVDGLDETNRVPGGPESVTVLRCRAFDAVTGIPAINVSYYWDIRGMNDEAIVFTELVSRSLTAHRDELRLDGLRPNQRSAKGRCLVLEPDGITYDASAYFHFNTESSDIPLPDESGKDPLGLIEPKKPNAHDDRVTVTVGGLNDDGILSGRTGGDIQLTCEATIKDGIDGMVRSLGWEFTDQYGRPVAANSLADTVDGSSQNGNLELKTVRQLHGAIAGGVKGRCVAEVELVESVSKPESAVQKGTQTVLYSSNYFGVSITEDGAAPENVEIKDLQGDKISVQVEGLAVNDTLLAETGDRIKLMCVAKDVKTGEVVHDVIYSWEFRNRRGDLITNEEIAEKSIRTGNTLELLQLSPTDQLTSNKQRFGRCVVFDATNDHFYQSSYFQLRVLRPKAEEASGTDTRVAVRVKGITDDGLLVAEEQGTVTLECEAVDKETEKTFTSAEAIYQFQFTDATPDSHIVYGGHLADIVEQEVTEDGGIRLTLRGVKTGTWNKGHCTVVLLSDSSTKEPVRRYSSRYFWSSIRKAGDPDPIATQVKNRTMEIDDFTHVPTILVKVDGVNQNDTISAKTGEDIELRGYVIDIATGKVIDGMNYSWELRTLDDFPLVSSQLAETIETEPFTVDHKRVLRLTNYKASGEGVQVRCIATATDVVTDPGLRGKKFASPVYTFQTVDSVSEGDEPSKVTGNQYDPNKLKVEVVGLNSDGTLSKKAGESVKLACEVVDKNTGLPIEDDFEIGWSFGTGPDGRPITLDSVASTVGIKKMDLELTGLKQTPTKSGGLRSRCVVSLGESRLIKPEEYPNKSTQIDSDTFVIHVDPNDDEPMIEPSDKAKPPFIHWIPGKDPKSSVIVKVSPLESDGSVHVKPGGNMTLACIALDAVNLQKIMPTESLTPLFMWELRNQIGGQLLDYAHVSKDKVRIVQPSDVEDSSELHISGMRKTPDAGPNVVGRCSVRMRDQMFRSEYFHIKLVSSGQLKDYEIVPKDFWSDDGAVSVLVRGLDPEGNVVTDEGSDADLQCEARNTKSGQLLRSDQVTYGWQTIDPQYDSPVTPLGESSHLSGSELKMKKLYSLEWEKKPLTLWSWCLASITSSGPDGEQQMRHYRSKPFKVVVEPKDIRNVEEKDKLSDAFSVRVRGLDVTGVLRGTEDDDLTLTCEAIALSTGKEQNLSRLTYGWEWRTLDGELAHISLIGNKFTSQGNILHMNELKPSVPVKGRCVVIDRPTIEGPAEDEQTVGQPRKFVSDYFHVSIEPSDPSERKPSQGCQPYLAEDQDVTLEVQELVDDEVRLQVYTKATVFAVVQKTAESMVKIHRFGYELMYHSGRAAQTGELATNSEFSTENGVLSLDNVLYPSEPLKIRFHVILLKSGADEMESTTDVLCGARIYRSVFVPIKILATEGTTQPTWVNLPTPIYDIKADAYNVKILGLDESGNASGLPDGQVELLCTVRDKLDSEAELNSNSYSWQLTDWQGQPINPGLLASQVTVESGSKLKLIGYRSSTAEQLGIRGRCVVSLPVPFLVNATITADKPPTQRYSSSHFFFTTAKPTSPITPVTEEGPATSTPTSREEHVTTPQPDEKGETTALGFKLQFDSSTNSIYDLPDEAQTILARNQRPFELSCRVVFSPNYIPPRSASGELLPRLVWFYRQPEIPGDVPIPSQLFPVRPPRMETLIISPQEDHAISIKSDAYSFRDESAEFQCNAYMDSDDVVTQKIVYVQKIKEQYNVRIFDENSRGRVYAFVGATKTLTCFVDDVASGERVEPQSYQWEVSPGDGAGDWIQTDSPNQPAETIRGWRSNQLLLESMRLPEDFITAEATYEFRCTVKHNSTFDTTSRPFIMSIRDKPRIRAINLVREKPTEAVLDVTETPEDSYDATADYQLSCRPEVSGTEASAVWQKCQDEECTAVEDLLPTGSKLFLFVNSTRYVDEGLFRCQVSLQLKEYNFKLIEYRTVHLKRKSAPAVYSSDAVTYTVNDEMSLQCTDESSSPESIVEWNFEPVGKEPPERKNPTILGKTYAYGRIYIFAISRGQLITEHSGKYTCTATNPYGTAKSTIDVTVTEDTPRDSRRSSRWRFRRLLVA